MKLYRGRILRRAIFWEEKKIGLNALDKLTDLFYNCKNPEEKLERWIGRYKKYLRGKDYFFYDPSVPIIENKLQLIQYLRRNNDDRAVNKVLDLVNRVEKG